MRTIAASGNVSASMDVLPSFIEVLSAADRAFVPRRRLQRVATGGRSEADWDKIIAENVELLADALRQAEMIGEDATLICLGAQIDNIDLVFAEVGDERHELRRLVLLENKLLRNHQARREVLAQILDYAETAREEWPSAKLTHLVEKLKGPAQWVENNEEELRQSCLRGDFLLIIAGDGIDAGLAKLARRFAGKDDPLSLTELALVSMALYQMEDEYLLIPHVVSAVLRSQREITVRVLVTDVHGRAVPAAISRDVQDEAEQASRGRLPVRAEVSRFLHDARDTLNAEILPNHPGMEHTAKPRKSLYYRMSLDDGATEAKFKIHFGGYDKNAWAPIYIGLMLQTKNAALREAWAQCIDPALPDLPDGTAIENAGPRTLWLRTSLDWTHEADLDAVLVSAAARTLLQFVAVLKPVLDRGLGGLSP